MLRKGREGWRGQTDGRMDRQTNCLTLRKGTEVWVGVEGDGQTDRAMDKRTDATEGNRDLTWGGQTDGRTDRQPPGNMSVQRDRQTVLVYLAGTDRQTDPQGQTAPQLQWGRWTYSPTGADRRTESQPHGDGRMDSAPQ